LRHGCRELILLLSAQKGHHGHGVAFSEAGAGGLGGVSMTGPPSVLAGGGAGAGLA